MPAEVKPGPIPTPDERAARALSEQRADARDKLRAFVLAALGCIFWCAAGLALIGWSFHTTDDRWAHPAFLTGLIVGYSGIFVTLARFYLHGERVGWW